MAVSEKKNQLRFRHRYASGGALNHEPRARAGDEMNARCSLLTPPVSPKGKRRGIKERDWSCGLVLGKSWTELSGRWETEFSQKVKSLTRINPVLTQTSRA